LALEYENNINHPVVAEIYNNLGVVYQEIGFAFYYNGEYDEAIKYHKKALEARLIVHQNTPDHTEIAASYSHLGAAYYSKGTYDEAVRYSEKALSIKLAVYTTSSNPNHHDIVDSYNNLGLACHKIGKYNEAIRCFDKALAIRLIAYASTPNHPAIAASYNDLANVYRDKGEYEQEINYFQLALAVQLKIHDNNLNHSDIASSYATLGVRCHTIGLGYYEKGEYENAINYFHQALEIALILYQSTFHHPDIAHIYKALGAVYHAKGEYDEVIAYFQQALTIELVLHQSIPNHNDIAISYNDLGKAYRAKGEYDEAMTYFHEVLTIRLIEHKNTPNHPDIARSYYTLGLIYYENGEYDLALHYFSNVLRILDNGQDFEFTTTAKVLFDTTLVQLGNIALLAHESDKARGYYTQINNIYQQIEFNSAEFIQLQFEHVDIARANNSLHSAINCQLVLLKIDPELQYANHYHNLACFYACQGNIEKANKTFINALAHPNANITGALYVEYVQFLIINRENDILNVNIKEISEYLYSAINSTNMSGLQYRKIEKDTVCNILKDLIKQKNATIQVNPKVFAYYLLIQYPEYIISMNDSDGIGTLLESFHGYCDSLQDEISFKLLADAYEFFGNKELALHCSRYAEVIARVNDIIAGKVKLHTNDGSSIDLIAREFANNLDLAGLSNVSAGRFNDAINCYYKLFQICTEIHMEEHNKTKTLRANLVTLGDWLNADAQIYNEILMEKFNNIQTALNKLATVYLLANNIEKFTMLKFEGHAELNYDLIRLSGHDLDEILAIEQLIINQPRVEKSGYDALIQATLENNQDMLLALILNGANPNQQINIDNNTLMHLAHYQGNLDIIKLLLQNGGNINSQNDKGQTPLHGLLKAQEIDDGVKIAIIQDEDLCNFYDLSIQDNHGKTALDYALESSEILASVIFSFYSNFDKYEATLDNVDLPADTNTPMHIAHLQGCAGVIMTLLENDGVYSINSKNHEGKTPLRCLLENPDIIDAIKVQIIREFSNFYDFSLKDTEGKTVLDYAIEYCSGTVAAIILSLWHSNIQFGEDENINDNAETFILGDNNIDSEPINHY